MNFEAAYAKLNKQQKAAVDKIDGPLLVIAGPGTGKTQLLSTRVANILQKTDANPENILCLTFTEAGASAMRSRLRDLIGPVAGKVQISTYHAFGSDIIYLYNQFAERVVRKLDAPIDGVRQHKILTTLRDGLRHNDILRGAKVADLVSTIAEVKTARLSASDLLKIAEANVADSAEISRAVAEILGDVPKGAKYEKALPLYARVREELVRFSSKKTIVGKVEWIGNGLLDSLNEVILAQEAAEKPSTGALTKWRERYFEKDEKNRFVLSSTVANKKLASLAGLLQKYDEYLAAEGLFDFADMIEEAIGFLRKDEAFRYSIQERYQYVLLDEFQDTNDSQLELIRLLADDERPNIMAVGDDDQAIFAFQGARYSNLMDFAEAFGAEVVVLGVNYRSGQEVIDLGGAVADQISERFSSKYGVEKRLMAYGTDASQIERREFLGEPSEYGAVAGRISELIAAGVAQKSIAVIAPKHKYLEALVPYFGEHKDIRLAYDKREDVLEAPTLLPLLAISRVVVDLARLRPTAREILPILGYDFWGLKPLTVIRTVAEAKTRHLSVLDYLLDSEDAGLHAIAEFLGTLAVKSLDTPLEIMIDYILGSRPLGEFRSPYLEYFTGAGGMEAVDFYESLAVLREHVSAYHAGGRLRLQDLVDFAEDYAAADTKLLNTSPYVEASDAVRLLSAHGAKGLEFDYVFLISLHDRSWGTGKGNNNTLVLPKNLEFVRHTGATDDEKLRLLFVAVTRAKHNLFLSGSRADFAGKAEVPLRYLDGIGPEIVSVTEVGPAPALLRSSWSGRYDVREADVRMVAERNVENYRLSATDLTSFIDLAYGGPEKFYLSRVLHQPQERSASLSYGNFVHAVLDRVCKDKISDEVAMEYYQELVADEDMEEEDRVELLERGEDDLVAYLRTEGEFLREKWHFSEVDFRRDNLVVGGGVPLTGKIDHMVADESSKTILVLDFKTGKYHKEGWDAQATLYKYKRQLMFYKLLVEASPKWRGYRVESAAVDFVTPDERGVIRRKELSFSDGEMVEFERLCGVVYGKIRMLDFPDVSGYSADLGGMKGFVADLIR